MLFNFFVLWYKRYINRYRREVNWLVTHLAIILYTTKNYNKKENIYFQGVIYAYAAVLGIQILQSGNYISDYGLSQNVAIVINCFNLISFANVIKFADNLDSKEIALSYMIITLWIILMVVSIIGVAGTVIWHKKDK